MALGADELMNRFGPCMGIIEHRVHNLKNLNRVKGRLDLLLNQMEDMPHVDPIETPNEHLVVYEDESDGSGDEKNMEGSSYGSSDDEDEVEANGKAMNGIENGTSASEEDENMLSEDEDDSDAEEDEEDDEDDDDELESD